MNPANNKLINVKNATAISDAVNLQQLNEAALTVAGFVARLYLKKDGTTLLTGNLNLINYKIMNMKDTENNQGASTKSYTD